MPHVNPAHDALGIDDQGGRHGQRIGATDPPAAPGYRAQQRGGTVTARASRHFGGCQRQRDLRKHLR